MMGDAACGLIAVSQTTTRQTASAAAVLAARCQPASQRRRTGVVAGNGTDRASRVCPAPGVGSGTAAVVDWSIKARAACCNALFSSEAD